MADCVSSTNSDAMRVFRLTLSVCVFSAQERTQTCHSSKTVSTTFKIYDKQHFDWAAECQITLDVMRIYFDLWL